MRSVRAFPLIFALATCTSGLFGQGGRGTILGTITDESGASVPKVPVTVTNIGTQQRRTASTDERGNFEVTALDVGSYELVAQAKGFRTASVQGILVEVEQRVRVDVKLAVGELTQRMLVEANAAALQTDDATVSTVISSAEIRELPLPQNRNLFQLSLLAPGMSVGPPSSVTTSNFGPGFGVAAMGMKVQANAIFLDGSPLRTNIHGVTRMRPSVEAIEEFRVEAGWYSAEYGTNSGAQIIATIRPGTNSFHGVLFEFLRNDKFDAHNLFDAPGATKKPLRRNTFGGVLSGPVLRNKTFFTMNTEIFDEHRSTPAFAAYPSSRMKAGDLTEPNFRHGNTPTGELIPIMDPRAGGPFANNQIPASRISPIAQKFFPLWPAPNCGSGLYDGTNNYCGVTKTFNLDDQVFGRIDQYISAKDKLFGHYGYQNILMPVTPLNPGPTLAGINDPFVTNNKRRQQNATIHYTRIISPAMINEMMVSYNRDRYGNADNLSGSSLNIFQQFGIPGQTTNPVDVGAPSLSMSNPSGLGTVAPNTIWEQNRRAADHFSWNKGRHALKLGTELSYLQVDRRTVSFVDGAFGFNGQNAGTAPGVLPSELSRLTWADFILDLPSRVFLGYNPATRGASGTYPRIRYRNWNAFVTDDWKLAPTLTMNIGLRMEHFSRLYDKNGQTRNFDFSTLSLYPAPYTSAPLNDPITNWAPRIGFAWRPFGGASTVIRTGYGIFYNFGMVNTWVPNLATNPPNNLSIQQFNLPGQVLINMATADQASALAISNAIYAVQPHAKSYAQNWNFNIQRALPKSVILEVGYAGSKSTHFDQPHGLNLYVPGTTVRQYPQYGGITYYSYDVAGSYNGLLTKVEKRFSGGLTFVQTYTWSKTMFDNFACCGTTWGSNPFNYRAEKGRAEWDVRHRSTSAWLYELPFFKGKRNFTGQLLGGWQVNGTMTIATGMPLNILQSALPVQDGCPGCGYRPDLVGNPHLDNPSVQKWFNTAAFATASGHYGNAGRNILTNPGLFDIDFSVFKNFPITESKTIQFRWENYNFTNTPPLNAPDGTLGSGSFGRITTAGNGREMQFALRFQF